MSTDRSHTWINQVFWLRLISLSIAAVFIGGAGPFPPASVASRGFVYPLSGPRISSDFGTRKHPKLGVTRHHDGMDLAAPHGTPVRAISDGVAVFADPRGGYGNLIVVVHPGGLSSHYGHLQSMSVTAGARIKAGQLIGRVGSTGISTGPHLHFEIRSNGVAGDPEKYIPGLADLGEG